MHNHTSNGTLRDYAYDQWCLEYSAGQFKKEGLRMMTVAIDREPTAVVANTFPYDQWHDYYQQYYQTSLRQFLQSQGSDLHLLRRTHFSTFLKVLRRVRDASALRRVMRSKGGAGTYVDWVAQHIGAQ